MLHGHIYDKFVSAMDSADQSTRGKVRRSADSIFTWCSRESMPVKDAPTEDTDVMRVVPWKGGFRDVILTVRNHMIMRENMGLLGSIDERFLKEVRRLTDSGVKDGHVILYCEFLKHVTSGSADELFMARPKNWLLTKLMFKRIEETVRMVERVRCIDKFGPIVSNNQDGSTTFDYDGRVIKNELKRRGVLKSRRR